MAEQDKRELIARALMGPAMAQRKRPTRTPVRDWWRPRDNGAPPGKEGELPLVVETIDGVARQLRTAVKAAVVARRDVMSDPYVQMLQNQLAGLGVPEGSDLHLSGQSGYEIDNGEDIDLTEPPPPRRPY